jgi:hypothetical protein
VSLIRLEQQVHGTSDGAAATPNGGDNSVVSPQNDRQQGHPRRRGTDGDIDVGADGHKTVHKIEFPKFNCVGDPLPWLNRCERYFRLCDTLAQEGAIHV